VRARTSSSGEFSARRMASASSVPGSVSMITFLGVAGEVTPFEERAFPSARVTPAPTKVMAARTSAMHAAIAAPRDLALRAETFGRVTARRELLRTAGERSEDSALQSFTDCGIIIGITSGQGPPSPQNGSRLSLGSHGVNTKLNASARFPQSANEFHKRTEQYENRDEH
jgi:hypothetical protein